MRRWFMASVFAFGVFRCASRAAQFDTRDANGLVSHARAQPPLSAYMNIFSLRSFVHESASAIATLTVYARVVLCYAY